MASSVIAASKQIWSPFKSVDASTSSTIVFTDMDTGNYSFRVEYDLTLSNNNVNVSIRTSSNNGSSYDSGSTDYYSNRKGNGATDTTYNGISSMLLNGAGVGNDTGEGICGVFTIFNPSAAKYTRLVSRSVFTAHTGDQRVLLMGGTRQSAADVNAIQFILGAGTMTGTVRMYAKANA